MGSYRLVKMLNPISITVNGTFTPKGAYNAGTSYSVGDQVDYNGTSYILYSAASAGTLPTDNTKWGVLASKGDTGTTGSPGTNGTNGTNGLPGADGYTPIKGVDYFDGATGAPGSPGSNGTNGTNGQGVPTGGTTGQQLAKINGTDYNTQWVNPVDISGKQDTLVSGTSIKTINSTSLLGSGDIVVAAGSDPLKEDVANKSTTTTLGTSDTLYPSQKAVKTYVDTTAGAYVPLAGGTMTGTLNTQTLLPTANLTYNLGGTSNYNLNTYTQKLYLNSTAYIDGAVAGTANLTGNLGILATSGSATHSLTLGSTSTGIALYNTSSQTTNFERGTIAWESNVFTIRAAPSGTGTARVLKIGVSPIFTSYQATSSTAKILNDVGSSGRTGLTGISNIGTFTQSTSTSTFFALTPTITQTSTAGYTALLINPTETTTGSGAKYLIDAQVGGASKAIVHNTGDAEITTSSAGVILKSPNGTRWRVTIDNTGALNSTAI